MIFLSRMHVHLCAQLEHDWKGCIELRGEMHTFRFISNYVELLTSGL